MEKTATKTITGFMLFLSLTGVLGAMFATTVKAQSTSDSHTVALWRFDEVTTPDATDSNDGILGGSPAPALVAGKAGEALSFDGTNFVYVPMTPSMSTPTEITIEAWINVNAFKMVTYNNIAVEYTNPGSEWQTASRLCGLAVKAGLSENGVPVPQGAIGGFVQTDTAHFNEIVTTEPVVPLNQWVHVAFTRSPDAGMLLYVNGVQKETKAVYGVQNPTGSIVMGTNLIIGHDAKVAVDELRISDTALKPSQFLTDLSLNSQLLRSQIDIGPNLVIAVVVVAVVFAVAWLLRRAIQMWAIRSKP